MKKTLLLLLILIPALFTNKITAQDFEWAYTSSKAPLTHAVAIRKDLSNNFYLASQKDSSSGVHVSSEIEKHDASQQLLWNKILRGNVFISDLELNAAQHAIVVGYYMDSLSIDATTIHNNSFSYSGFICELDESGNLIWLHDINVVNDEFKPYDLFIAQNGDMYITTELNGIADDFTSFHKLDLQGNIIKSEFNHNSEVRTNTNIIADNDGNIYLSGTCGNIAQFDSIQSNPNFSYQNFVMKYDSTFKALWFNSRNYITFDHNNSLQLNGQNLYWVFDDFTSQNGDTVKIIKMDLNGNILNEIEGPIPQSFFPGVQFSMDGAGNSILGFEVFARLFLFRYDPAFTITWQDTILTSASGFPRSSDIRCYDSTFYLAGYYYNDTLEVGNFSLVNPNQGANSPSDLFVCKWNQSFSTGLPQVPNAASNPIIYPNPASSTITIKRNITSPYQLTIFDVSGRLMKEMKITESQMQIDLREENFARGVYVFNFSNDKSTICKKVIIE